MFLHGGDYNPEQWLDVKDPVWKEDMLHAKEAGINCLTVGIFSWSFLEPEDGVYDFSFLDEVMDMLHQNGMKAILATPSGARPPWMVKKYPSVLRMTAERLPHVYGGRHNACMSSPDFRRKVTEINTLLAKRYGSHPALIGWHVSNEYNNDCHCPACQESFRRWLKDRYGTIDNLNHSWWNGFWSHWYHDFSEIESPTAPYWNGEAESPAHLVAWRRYCSDKVVEFFRMECEPLRKYTPNIPVTANMMHTFTGINYFDLGRAMDVASWDNYPVWKGDERDGDAIASVNFRHDLMRGTGGQKPFWMMESCPGAVNWMDHNSLRIPGTVKHQGMAAIAHGSDSVQYFQYRAGRGGSEQFHGSVLPPDGRTDTRTFREVSEVGRTLQAIGKAQGSVTRNRVALLYDWNCRWMLDNAWLVHRGNQNYEGTAIAHYQALQAAGIGVDVVDEQSSLEGYQALVIPMGFVLMNGFAEKCKDFAKKGGRVFVTYMSGYVNEEMLRYDRVHPLDELTGVRIEEMDALDESRRNTFTWNGKQYDVFEMAQLVTPQGAEVLSVYEKQFYAGQPMLTRNGYGDGACYTLQGRTDWRFLRDFYGELLRDCVILPDLPEGVLATERFGEHRWLFLENANHFPVQVKLDGSYTNEITGEKLSGEIILPDFEVMVLRDERENHV